MLTGADELGTAETIRNKFMRKSGKPHLALEIFADCNKKMAALVGKEYTKGTLCRYETSLKHTRDFLKRDISRPTSNQKDRSCLYWRV